MVATVHSWTRLFRQAERLGIRPVAVAALAVADRVAKLRAQLADLTDEATAIMKVADDESRDLSADEQARWSALMDAEKGEIAATKQQLASAEKVDREKRALALLRDDNARGQNPLDPLARGAGGEANALRPAIPRRQGRLRAFHGPDADRNAYLSGMFLRASCARLRHTSDAEAESYLATQGYGPGGARNTHVEGTNSLGGFLVPDPLSSAIIDVRETHGLLRRVASFMPMTADTLTIPKRLGGLTVSYSGEGLAIAETEMTWGNISLTAVKRTILTKVTNELAADALINMVDHLVTEIGTAFAVREDRELVQGDGTATNGGEAGLLNRLGAAGRYTSPVGRSTWALINIADHRSTMAVLPSRFSEAAETEFGPAWVCSRQYYYDVMCRLMDAAGGNNWQTIEVAGSMRPMFLNTPVWFTDFMPTATAVSTVSCLYGNWRQAVMVGSRAGIEIGQSDQFAFNEDVTTLRATSRYDINVHEPGDGSNAGAYVGLRTAAS
ncbi:MAG: phage major capsid protein [Lacipirellulaceae bacterium]